MESGIKSLNLPRKFLKRSAAISSDKPARPAETDTLLCDPLTGLVAYKCFERHATQSFAACSSSSLTLAIGDVDNLRDYVTSENARAAGDFGHLAGNRCMEIVGETVRAWEQRIGPLLGHILAGTFGGDEVIILMVGINRSSVRREITALAEEIAERAPRPCSFAWAYLEPGCNGRSRLDYRSTVSTIDEALFNHKELRARGETSSDLFVLEVEANSSGEEVPR